MDLPEITSLADIEKMAKQPDTEILDGYLLRAIAQYIKQEGNRTWRVVLHVDAIIHRYRPELHKALSALLEFVTGVKDPNRKLPFSER